MSKPIILICDDDNDILEVTSLILSKEYNVKTKNKLHDPVEIVLEENPCLVLMDIWIPEVGGEEAVRLLKANHATKDIPVIFFSANTEIKKMTADCGADGYISKPFTIRELKDYINRYLSRRLVE